MKDAAGVVRHSATVTEANALIAEVSVSLNRLAHVFVEYDNPLAGRYRTRLGAAAAEHTIPIVRLRPETTYDYTIFTTNGADESDAIRGPSGSFTTEAVPGSLASTFKRVVGRSSQPLIMSDYTVGNQTNAYFVFWDETGALVWYLGVEIFGPVARSPGQENFLFVSQGCCLRQFTPLGKATLLAHTRNTGKLHHDLLPLDGGRVLLPIANSVHVGSSDEHRRIFYDSLAIWHSATGHAEEVWNAKAAWDILDPAQHWNLKGDGDWTHLNSVSLGERGNILLSLRNRSQVISLTPDYEIEWQLHGPESDYEFPDPTDRFYKQHTASQLANGNILLFDNGQGRPGAEGGEYSRALELRLDDEAGTAAKAWEYRPSPDIYSPAKSSAYRLDSGNTLVNFGINDEERSRAPLVVVEADANGNEVFRVETVHIYERPIRYRAYGGIKAIYGETMLRPPTAFVQRAPPVRRHYQRMMHVAATTFDLYLEDGYLVYTKTPCTTEDTEMPFFLHVRPKRANVLPESRRAFGFDNLDFKFFQRGLLWQGRCHVEVPLPSYEIDRIRTGQFGAEDQTKDTAGVVAWDVEIPFAPRP